MNKWMLGTCVSFILSCGGSEKSDESGQERAGRELNAGSYSLQDRGPDISKDGKKIIFLSAQSGKVQIHAAESEFGTQGTLRLLTTEDIGQPVVARLHPDGDSVVVWSWKEQKLLLSNITWEGAVTTLHEDSSRVLHPLSEGVAFSSIPDLFAYTLGSVSSTGSEKIYVQYRTGSGLGRYIGEGRVLGWESDKLWIQKNDEIYTLSGWTGDGRTVFGQEAVSLEKVLSGVLQTPYPNWLGASQTLSMARGTWRDVYPVTSTDPMAQQSLKHWKLSGEEVSWQSSVPGHDMLTWSGSRSEEFGFGVSQIHYVCPDRQDQYGRALVSFSATESKLILPKNDLSGLVASTCDSEDLDLSVMQVALMTQATSTSYRVLWTTLQGEESKVRMLELHNGQQTIQNLSAESLALHGLD